MRKKLSKLLYSAIVVSLALLLALALSGCKDTRSEIDDGDSAGETTGDTTPTVTESEPTQSTVIDEQEYKYVAFTFDDGPHDDFTKRVVDTLKEYGGHATFFVVGDRINDKSAETIKYAYENGNEIGMHSFTHTHYFDSCDDKTYDQEVKYTKNRLSSFAGVNATLLRPPGGLMSAERIASSQYPVILWSVDSLDWRYKTASSDEERAKNVQTIVDNVLSAVDDGDIILMHDIYENTYLAFRVIIKTLHEEGYRFVTVSELLGDSIRSGAKFHSVTAN